MIALKILKDHPGTTCVKKQERTNKLIDILEKEEKKTRLKKIPWAEHRIIDQNK